MYKKLIAMLVVCSLAACSSDDSEKEVVIDDGNTGEVNPTLSYNVDAVFFKGLVTGADCSLYSINTGTQHEEIASGQTNNEGVVSFEDINYAGNAIIECSGGSYEDEATEQRITNEIPKIINIAKGFPHFRCFLKAKRAVSPVTRA